MNEFLKLTFSFSFIARTHPQNLRQETSGRLRGPTPDMLQGVDQKTVIIHFLMGLSQPLFGFIFPFFMVHCKLTVDEYHNGKMMIGNRKEEGRICTFLLHVNRKSPVIIDWQQFWTEKSQSPTRDSNLACPDRMPSLYQVSHHHFPTVIIHRVFL